MTARHQTRVGRRLRGERTPIDVTSAPSVGDLLHAAREKKGVDLYRAERDTKIRARHLSALEDGDYAELPGSVYTKGFLRNYALYLGLDPVEVLARWHDEQDATTSRSTAAAVVAPPQPLTDPRRGLTFTPSLVVAAALSVIVLLFLAYVGMQLFRFSQVPELRLDGGSLIQAAEDQTSYQLSGTGPVRATIKALDAAGTMVRSADASEDGRWSLVLPVQKGRNEFSLSARDPETGRESTALPVIITVAVRAKPTPIPTPAPTGLAVVPLTSVAPDSQSPDLSAAPSTTTGVAALSISTPQDGGRSGDPTVAVKGSTNARTVRVSPRWVGSGKAPADPEGLRLDVRGGDFSGELVLPSGKWAVDVTTVATDKLASTTGSATVNVDYNGFAVEVGATPKGRAWIQIWVDGQPVDAGGIMSNGDRTVVVAKRTVVINTGVEKSTVVGVGGEPATLLGPRNDRAVWRLEKGKAPLRLQ